jgi:hypothetical protein
MKTLSCAVFCLLLTAAFTIHAETRVALVIGNSRYEGGTWLPLANPARDAQAVAQALKSLGFQVVGCGTAGVCLDATREAMESALLEFGRTLRASPGAVAFVYYAGHGVQAQRRPDTPPENFLVPVRSGLEEDFQAASKAISVQELLDELAAVGVQTGIVVLDACRDNGLKRSTMAANTRGLALSEAGGFLIAYSTEPGKVAIDALPGSAIQLSPYARRLAEQLVIPGKSITDVFVDVGAQVAEDTRGQQNPEATIRLKARSSKLYLAGTPRPNLQPPPAASLPTEQTPSNSAAPAVPPLASLTAPAEPSVFGHRVGETFRDCSGCPKMVVIPTGRFMMGSPSTEKGHQSLEGPMHEVHISYAFAVSKYPITRGEWKQFVKETGHKDGSDCLMRQEDDHPVVCVSWQDAQD